MKGAKITALYCLVLFAFVNLKCNSNDKTEDLVAPSTNNSKEKLFDLLPPEATGVYFRNKLTEDASINLWDFDYIYNGSGVAAGDLNNDGLPDLYFTGNMVSNQLYLNKGNMVFEDISTEAGVAKAGGWNTGTTMADVNGDGYLDIYVCRSYSRDKPELRANLLYINNGDLTFTESAEAYGLNDASYSTQATFFDYDKDGDLDMYLLNYPGELTYYLKERFEKRKNPPLAHTDKLYRNNGDGTFSDVTVSSKILNYSWGLGVVAVDINDDGWTDIYVANDFEEPDYLYINNQDGTFTDMITQATKHISNFGMGVDVTDINNDGLLDIIVLDMLAQDNYRQKTQMPSMAPELFWMLVEEGYHFQYMRNTLQLNNGNGTFSEIGQLAGIAKTDWSWAPLVADFNNDGYKDLFVTNGYRRNSRDRDYKNKWDELVSTNELVDISIDEYHSMMTITQLRNYYFENNGDLTFTDRSIEYGLDHTGFSNGGTFADLDKDGDLDIVVNNLQTPAYIYQNNSDLFDSTNYLRIKLVGTKGNSFALGTKVRLKVDDQILYQELTLTRGFQSSVESILHFGLGKHELVEELLVIWSDGRITEVYDLNANQLLIIEQEDANKPSEEIKQISPETIFQELGDQYGADFIHTENDFDDYKREILLPHKMSQLGPGFAVGDVNGDQLEDFYITGAYGQSGGLYIQQANFKFRLSNDQPWGSTLYEETGALLFDADTDGDLDLYIVSGGNEFDKNAINLQDRLFLNDGKGRFVESKSNLPLMTTSGSCVKAGDYDKDGDLDLFVGGRQVPGKYPFPARSYLLRNDGGRFTDVTSDIAPGLLEPGMVSSTVWTDFDNDGQLDLIIVGEWMPITIFKNSNGMFKNITKESGLSNTTGWWNKIIEGDFDNDSDPDYVIGNLGLNYKYKATEKEPLHVYCHDFDNNGTLDIVLGYYNNGECYPVRGRECSSDQMPVIADRFPTYDAFGRANLADIYGSNLESALHYEATLFASSYMENLGNGQFSLNNLPVESQFSAVFGIVANDFNQDGNLDLLISGNFFVSEIETGRADASIGLYMTGNGNGEFQAVKVTESGFNTPLDVRDMVMLGSATDGSILILVANNNDKMQMFRTTLSASVQQ